MPALSAERDGIHFAVFRMLFGCLLALFFTPVFTAVPALATAPALIAVGALMMQATGEVDWRRTDEAVPAFLTIAAMPFTFSIANGIALGIVTFVAIRVLAGRPREVSGLLWVVAALVAAWYAFV